MRANVASVDLSLPSLLVGFLISGIGFVLLSYGRKMKRAPIGAGGLALLIAPYFAPNVWAMFGISLLIGAGVWAAVRAGW